MIQYFVAKLADGSIKRQQQTVVPAANMTVAAMACAAIGIVLAR
jgi:hypothetical protein